MEYLLCWRRVCYGVQSSNLQMFYHSPTKTKKRRQKEQIFDQSIELEKRVKCMGDPLDGDNSIVEYLPESQCKTCKSQWASHLRIGLCKLSHVSNHIYAKYLSKNMECPEILLHNWCGHKGHIHKNMRKMIIITDTNTIDIHAKCTFKCQVLIGVDTLIWACNTTKDMILCYFAVFYKLAYINYPWVNNHVGLMFGVLPFENE